MWLAVTIDLNLEALLLAFGALLTGGGSLLSGFAAVVKAFNEGAAIAGTAAGGAE